MSLFCELCCSDVEGIDDGMDEKTVSLLLRGHLAVRCLLRVRCGSCELVLTARGFDGLGAAVVAHRATCGQGDEGDDTRPMRALPRGE